MEQSRNLAFFEGARQPEGIQGIHEVFQDTHDFYKDIKTHCYNPKKYKWSIKRYTDFVKKNNLSHAECHSALTQIFNNYNEFRNQNKLFKKFLLQIEKKIEVDFGSKIKIKEGKEKEFISGLIKLLENCTELPKGKILKTTYQTISTNLTWLSFRSYYYDDRFNCE